jgi:hypothetical protein
MAKLYLIKIIFALILAYLSLTLNVSATSMGLAEVQKYLSAEWVKNYCTSEPLQSSPEREMMEASIHLYCSVM